MWTCRRAQPTQLLLTKKQLLTEFVDDTLLSRPSGEHAPVWKLLQAQASTLSRLRALKGSWVDRMFCFETPCLAEYVHECDGCFRASHTQGQQVLYCPWSIETMDES